MKKQGLLFRLIKKCVKIFYKTPEFSGVENLAEEPTIIVANHAQIHGPIIAEVYMPFKNYTWITGEMLSIKTIPNYAYEDFWRFKPKAIRWFYRLLSYIVAPLFSYIFNNANGIGVYRDIRIANTLKNTVLKIKKGNDIVIFPENREVYNHIINDFQKNFVDVARVYFKATGKELTFTPTYVAPTIKKVVFGKPIKFNSNASYQEEKERITKYLKEEITALALKLPSHTVIPYENIKKKHYKKSK